MHFQETPAFVCGNLILGTDHIDMTGEQQAAHSASWYACSEFAHFWTDSGPQSPSLLIKCCIGVSLSRCSLCGICWCHHRCMWLDWATIWRQDLFTKTFAVGLCTEQAFEAIILLTTSLRTENVTEESKSPELERNKGSSSPGTQILTKQKVSQSFTKQKGSDYCYIGYRRERRGRCLSHATPFNEKENCHLDILGNKRPYVPSSAHTSDETPWYLAGLFVCISEHVWFCLWVSSLK